MICDGIEARDYVCLRCTGKQFESARELESSRKHVESGKRSSNRGRISRALVAESGKIRDSETRG